MANTPNYAGAPRIGVADINAANPNRDGTGTLVAVLVAGAGGSRVDRVHVQAVGATTDGMVRLFLNNGVASKLVREVEVAAIVPAPEVRAWEAEEKFEDLSLPVGWSLMAATENAEAFVVHAFGADY